MAPILYCRCTDCVCKATVLLTDNANLNQMMEDRSRVSNITEESDKDRAPVIIEEYVEHNDSNKDDLEMRVPEETDESPEPGLESMVSLIILILILICK